MLYPSGSKSNGYTNITDDTTILPSRKYNFYESSVTFGTTTNITVDTSPALTVGSIVKFKNNGAGDLAIHPGSNVTFSGVNTDWLTLKGQLSSISLILIASASNGAQVYRLEEIFSKPDITEVWAGTDAYKVITSNRLHLNGTTGQRPTGTIKTGFTWFNTTTGRPEWWNGSAWVDGIPKADQTEVNTGTNDTKFVTPLTLEGKLTNRVATPSVKGTVNQSTPVANVTAPDASTLPNSLATDVPEVVTDLNSVITELNALVTEVTEIKAQLNAKLAADRASGQQQS